MLTLWIAQGEPSDLVLLLLLDALGRFMLALDAADALRIVFSHLVSLALRTRLDGTLAIGLLRATFVCFDTGRELGLVTVTNVASLSERLLRFDLQEVELLTAARLVWQGSASRSSLTERPNRCSLHSSQLRPCPSLGSRSSTGG